MGKTLRVASHALKNEHFYDEEYKEYGPTGRSSVRTFGAINYAIRPHLNSRYFPEITEEKIQFVVESEKLAIYTLDDNCALKMVDGNINVVGGGEWHLVEPAQSYK